MYNIIKSHVVKTTKMDITNFLQIKKKFFFPQKIKFLLIIKSIKILNTVFLHKIKVLIIIFY